MCAQFPICIVTCSPGLHNKIPAHKIFARVWVAQEPICYSIKANIFQGLGPKNGNLVMETGCLQAASEGGRGSHGHGRRHRRDAERSEAAPARDDPADFHADSFEARPHIRGNHFCNTTCLVQVFFTSDE